jgi:hypothetical protein
MVKFASRFDTQRRGGRPRGLAKREAIMEAALLACPASRGVLFDQLQVVESTILKTTPGLVALISTDDASVFRPLQREDVAY